MLSIRSGKAKLLIMKRLEVGGLTRVLRLGKEGKFHLSKSL